MLSGPNAMLRRIRAFGTKFFHRFGIHCATHQIRVILISSVVITSLLYPAIAIASSSQTHFFAFSLRVLDAFLTPDDISSYFAHEDLRHIWEGHNALRVREDSVARARCGKESIIRSERILVHSIPQGDDWSSLNHDTLLATLKLEDRINDLLSAQRVPCIRTSGKRCLSLSPLAFWNHDERAILNDRDVLSTLGRSMNVSVSGITITPDMVLAGRGDATVDTGDTTMFLVLTYFFPDSDCLANYGHFTWLHILEDSSNAAGDLIMQAQEPKLIALEYEKNVSTSSRAVVLSVFTYTAYLLFLVYFWRSMRRMDTVHSRIGLAFTGIVEIVVSTLTSLSVCALVGFRVTMVPWEIFPIVVIFIGVENMFSIVDAVVKTSITLPVKERIAEGLSRAGTSNTLKLCSYNAVLGVIAFFSTGAIRQFCAFAIVVLVAHWFLVHTFFVTVLSIDIQRLELHELLRQDSSIAPSLTSKRPMTNEKRAQTKWARLVEGMHTLSRGRAGKNISLVLLLAITATLYHMTQPYSEMHVEPRVSSSRSLLARPPKHSVPIHTSPATQIWQTLNPHGYELVHVRIESPAIIVLGQETDTEEDGGTDKQRGEFEKVQRVRWSRLWTRAARRLVWLTKAVAAPTVVTTGLLYGLLLYLLKDAELLEAQRNRPEPDTSLLDDALPALEDHVSLTTLPRAFATDVDLVTATKDGSVVGTIGLRNEFVLWRMKTQGHCVIDTSDVLLGSSGSSPTVSSTLTAIALNDRGTFVAVGTGSGVVALWHITPDRVQPLLHLTADNLSAVTHIHFASTTGPSDTPATGYNTPRRSTPPGMHSTTSESAPPAELPGRIYVTYDNGAVIQWTVGAFTVPTYIKPSRSASVIKSMLLQVRADNRLLVGFCLEDGTLELLDVDHPDNVLAAECVVAAGNPCDLVSKVDVCSVEFEGETHIVIGAATQGGVVSLWDGATGKCMHILDEPFGMITDLHLTPVHARKCSTCGELTVESFCLSFSVGQVVLFYRCYLDLPTRRCACPSQQPKFTSSVLGRRSRSSSVASLASICGGSGTHSPAHSRSRISSFSSTGAFDTLTMFPVSAHGMHSRRITEKKSLEALSGDWDDGDTHPHLGPQDVTPTTSHPATLLIPGPQHSSIWENLVVLRTADATFERGGWDVADNKIVGIRRKPRVPLLSGAKAGLKSSPIVQLRPDSAKGLTAATLERWELWMYDPAESQLHASALVALDEDARKPQSKTSGGSMLNGSAKVANNDATPKQRVGLNMIPRLHFTRVSPFVSNRSFCLAGFGNTVGLFNFNASTGIATRQQRPSLAPMRMNS